MTAFRYRAVTADDRAEFGVLDADDPRDAARRLLDRGLYPLDLSARNRSLITILMTPIGGGGLSSAEAVELLADLGHLIGAGVEIAAALAIIASSKARRRIREVAAQLLEKVRAGRALSDAIADLPRVFPEHVTAVVRAGEVSGSLGPALARLADTQRRAAKLRSQAQTALIYPACVAAAVAVALVVLIGVVVPTLQTLFSGDVHRLPWQTRLLITLGLAVRGHPLALALGTGLIVLSFVMALRNGRARRRLEILLLRIPVLGALVSAAETARLTILLAMLATAGIPLFNAVAIASHGARLIVSREQFAAAAAKLREGAKLHVALEAAAILGPRVLALIRIGEMTGRLGSLLDEAARDSEHRVSTALERALALMTPAMTLIFGAVAGFILYAVMTSILSVNDFATRGH